MLMHCTGAQRVACGSFPLSGAPSQRLTGARLLPHLFIREDEGTLSAHLSNSFPRAYLTRQPLLFLLEFSLPRPVHCAAQSSPRAGLRIALCSLSATFS